MKLAALHPQLLGEWQGESRLWMSPAAPPLASASTLVVTTTAMGRFLTLAYTWVYDGRAQEGLMILGDHNQSSTATAGWVDSFHQSGGVMHCTGRVEGTGFAVAGQYAAPPGADWGWRLSVSALADGELLFEMHNVPPGGAPELAVQARYQRRAPG